ncbi:oxidoreductase-like protein [Trypanosoma grayi]|uniref:oxidoreductase-like protein n=1 Tax=Trypanosoma grayi TaxID=71804 RepID=UPI0004F3FC2C|nr:oxidoreductase-like protein [Trypanosoma grayi]KEG12053.1 oxidoreductase-like protein [Trypanosoma grayi]
MTPVARVGLLGVSAIARKVWAAIHKAGLVVTAVGGRSPKTAESFVEECCGYLGIDASNKPRACNYYELVNLPDVDIVYISLPVMERPAWVMKCVDKGKHVVGEKPPAENIDVLCVWLERLNNLRLLYMDGTMFSHGPWVEKLVENLPRCGRIRRLTATLSWCADEEKQKNDIRFNPTLENLGALGDCGWYCVRVMLHAMNFKMPKTAVGRILETNRRGAIVAFSGELAFEMEGEIVTGFLYCALNSAPQAEFTVSGTTGMIDSPNIYNPVTVGPSCASFKLLEARTEANGTELAITHDEHIIEVPEEDGFFQEVQMWRDVAAALSPNSEGKLLASIDAMEKWGHMAWMTQCILDTLVKSARLQQGV